MLKTTSINHSWNVIGLNEKEEILHGSHTTNYFDSDMSNSINMVVLFDEKGGTVNYIYVCGQGHTQFIR
jgi:hypothetical protein